jgi:cytoskeletal protein RodZ
VDTEFGTPERADRISAREFAALAETSLFGETLKRAREERGVRLDAVASATRIARHHLDALERGDLESLPSGPFGRSYLRAYAEFLGIDPEPVLDSYLSQEADKGLGPAASRERATRELARLLERRPQPRRFRFAPVLGAVAAASVLVGAWFLWRGLEPTRPREEQSPEAGVARVEQELLVQKAAATTPPVSLAKPAPAPDPEREPEPPREKEPSRPATVSVSESALGTDVVNHAVIGLGNRFSEGDRVAFWTRVHAERPGDVIHHYWLHEGRAVMRADLTVGSANWRTFSRYTLPDGASGSWIVEARDGTGRVLARAEFVCLERGG